MGFAAELDLSRFANVQTTPCENERGKIAQRPVVVESLGATLSRLEECSPQRSSFTRKDGLQRGNLLEGAVGRGVSPGAELIESAGVT